MNQRLLSCSICQGPVAATAKSCPHCGQPGQRPVGQFRQAVGILALAFFGLLLLMILLSNGL